MANTVTFKQLDAALILLGFKERRSGNFLVFHESSRDTTVLVPVNARSGELSAEVVAEARETIVKKGIADESRFDELVSRQEGDVPGSDEAGGNAAHTPISFADALAFKAHGPASSAKSAGGSMNAKLQGSSKTKSGAANQAKGRVKK